MSIDNVQATSNYLVPAAGFTTARNIKNEGVAIDEPNTLDLLSLSNDTGRMFEPQGVYVDTTDFNGEVEIVFQPTGTRFVIPGRGMYAFPYPAGESQTIIHTPRDPAGIATSAYYSMTLVDYPVLPHVMPRLYPMASIPADGQPYYLVQGTANPSDGPYYEVRALAAPLDDTHFHVKGTKAPDDGPAYITKEADNDQGLMLASDLLVGTLTFTFTPAPGTKIDRYWLDSTGALPSGSGGASIWVVEVSWNDGVIARHQFGANTSPYITSQFRYMELAFPLLGDGAKKLKFTANMSIAAVKTTVMIAPIPV